MPRRTSGRAGRTPNPVRTPRPRSSSHAAPPLPVSRVPEAGERRQALWPCPADPTLSVGYSCTSRVMGSWLADFCTAILTQARTSRGERKQRGPGRARRHGAVSGGPTRLHQSCRPTGPWRKGWARGVRSRGVRPDQLPPAFLPFSQPVGSPLGGEAFPQLPSGPQINCYEAWAAQRWRWGCGWGTLRVWLSGGSTWRQWSVFGWPLMVAIPPTSDPR